MARIFISYNRESEDAARLLARDLESLGHDSWLDQALSGGQAWWDRILAEIRSGEIFVFVLSPEGLDSVACRREYEYAAALGKPVLPVLVSDDVSTALLPPALSRIQFVDYRNQDRDAAFSLSRALSAVPAAPPPPDPLPPAPEVPLSYLGSLREKVSGADALSYEAQSALLLDLRRALTEPGMAGDALVVLKQLRRRRDLYATMADEIDVLLDGQSRPALTPAGMARAPATARSPATGRAPQASDGRTSTTRLEVSTRLTATDPDTRLAPEQRLRWARNLTIAGLVAGMLAGATLAITTQNLGDLGYLLMRMDYYSLAIGGALAGYMAGNRRRVLLGAMVGMALAAVLLASAYPGRVIFLLASLAATPIGALIGMIFDRQTGRASRPEA